MVAVLPLPGAGCPNQYILPKYIIFDCLVVLQALDRSKILRYAAQFPLPVKQQIVEALASFKSAQLHP
jgi:hypothetical protein